ncbi:MAG: hypothetical protein KGH79_03015 [Patescibacteria group bacterium]|nr:hypothetical protein [Patescibacteria group bacterium]
MNDDQLIERLRKLKKFEPKDETIFLLKNRVFSSIENKSSVFRPIFVYSAAALLFLVLIVTQGYRLLDMPHVVYLETHIALAPNGYEKARWSLGFAQFELKKLESGSTDSAQIAYLSDVSSETDRYMSELNLVGEPGQYSTQQCLDAYTAYEGYLDELQAAVQGALVTNTDSSVRASLLSLKDEAKRYQQAADVRLKLY